jgi:hypothetical protein
MSERRPYNFLDLAGLVFGRLTVIGLANEKTRHDRVQWTCKCSCGAAKVVSGNQLQRGITRSCGCLRKEITSAKFRTHGHSGSPTYLSYTAAKSRCENINNQHFADYGGRGIRFRFASFEQFLAELGERPSGTSLERIDNDGHYEPGNVRWATHQQQSNNKRTNRRITASGRTRTVAWWSRETGLSDQVIRGRLDLGWLPERALTCAPRVVRPTTSPRPPRGRPLEAFGRKLTIAAWSRETGISYDLIRARLVRGWSAEEALSATRPWSRRGDGVLPIARSARSS